MTAPRATARPTGGAADAAAEASAGAAPSVVRLLWSEGRLPAFGRVAAAARLDAPALAADDGRVCFALPAAALAASPLRCHAWPAARPLPTADDARWRADAFVVASPRRAGDAALVLRRARLAELPADDALAAALARSLREAEAPTRRWRLCDRELVLERDRPAIVAILNLTPDSFSDGGRLNALSAVERGEQLVAAGAALLDLGGESTRPGARSR